MATPFIAQITPYAFGFPPRGWATCNGQILPIAQNQALFSLLGTTYGGNGTNTFALPNLQGRAPMHFSSGHPLGQVTGAESHTLVTSELPLHNHGGVVATPMPASPAAGSASSPTGQLPAVTQRPSYADSANGSLGAPIVSNMGGNQPHPNLQPYLTLNLCIALQGIYPSRN